MTSSLPPEAAPPEVGPIGDRIARRNLRLGLIIGGICLAQIVVFIIIFSRNGLPKDPKVWKEQQARQALQATKDSHE